MDGAGVGQSPQAPGAPLEDSLECLGPTPTQAVMVEEEHKKWCLQGGFQQFPIHLADALVLIDFHFL